MPADLVIEDVPRLTRRYGDLVHEGSNNTCIILGTDRARRGPATIDDGLGHVDASGGGKGAGTVHIIAGRNGKEPDLDKDDAFVYISRKTKVDENLGTGMEGADNDVRAAILKSDHVRIVGRKNIKVAANDDDKHFIFIDGKKVVIQIGSHRVEMDGEKVKIDISQSHITADKGGNIKLDNGTCKLDMSPGLIKVDAPVMHLKGGCDQPYDLLFTEIVSALVAHDHMTVVGPSLPGFTGATAALSGKLSAQLTAWKAAAKE